MTRSDSTPRPVTLEGRFVRLAPLDLAHVHDLFVAGRDASIWQYMPVPPAKTENDTRAWVDAAVEATRTGREIVFAIVHRGSGRAIGSTRYQDIHAAHRCLEIGWTWIDAAYQRTAINAECKLLLLGHAFESLGAVRVQLKTDTRNMQSQQAIEQLGAHREGVLRKHRVCWDGHIRDTAMYSIVADEWSAVCARLLERLPKDDVILHIAPIGDWQAAESSGTYSADSLATEGFIHCSTRAQVVRVANERFRGRQDLVLLSIDPTRVAAPIRYENCEGGRERFPHLYGPLATRAIVNVLPFAPDARGNFNLPDDFRAGAATSGR